VTAVSTRTPVTIERPRARRRAAATVAAVTVTVGIALTVAACGGSGDDGSAKDAKVTSTPSAVTSTTAGGSGPTTTTVAGSGEPKTVAEARARAAVLIAGDVPGYAASGTVTSSTGGSPLVDCVKGLDVQDHTLAQAGGPRFANDDRSIVLDSTAITLDSVALAARVMKALDSQAVADCLSAGFTNSSTGAKGSFTVTAEADEPPRADQVESIYGAFTGLAGQGAPKVARLAVVAVRTSGVITVISSLSADQPDPKRELSAAVDAVATHQAL
jgi:hypothetical protein